MINRAFLKLCNFIGNKNYKMLVIESKQDDGIITYKRNIHGTLIYKYTCNLLWEPVICVHDVKMFMDVITEITEKIEDYNVYFIHKNGFISYID